VISDDVRAIAAGADRGCISVLLSVSPFHDAVLELGSVPLPVVTARVDRFIAEGGKGPYPDMD
jgi:hypothetical protein